MEVCSCSPTESFVRILCAGILCATFREFFISVTYLGTTMRQMSYSTQGARCPHADADKAHGRH